MVLSRPCGSRQCAFAILPNVSRALQGDGQIAGAVEDSEYRRRVRVGVVDDDIRKASEREEAGGWVGEVGALGSAARVVGDLDGGASDGGAEGFGGCRVVACDPSRGCCEIGSGTVG